MILFELKNEWIRMRLVSKKTGHGSWKIDKEIAQRIIFKSWWLFYLAARWSWASSVILAREQDLVKWSFITLISKLHFPFSTSSNSPFADPKYHPSCSSSSVEIDTNTVSTNPTGQAAMRASSAFLHKVDFWRTLLRLKPARWSKFYW